MEERRAGAGRGGGQGALAERCEQLGPGRRFLTREICRVSLREEEEPAIHTDECAAGVSAGMLSECLDRVEAEGCDDALGTLARIKACRPAQICRRDR